MLSSWSLDKITGVILALVALTLAYPATQGLAFVLLLMFFIQDIKGGHFSGRVLKKQPFSLLALALFVLLEITSLSYSSDLRFGMKQFEKLMPVIVVLILLFFFKDGKRFSFEKGIKYYSLGVVILLLVSACVVLYNILFGELAGKILYSGINNVDFLSEIGHRTYLGFVVLLAFPIWFEKIVVSSSWKNRLFYGVVLALAAMVVFLTGARAILLSMVVLLGFLSIYFINKKSKNSRLVVMLALGILVIGIGIIVVSPRFNLVVESLFGGDLMGSKEPRLYAWRAAWMTIRDQWFLGYGLGDGKGALQEAMREIQYSLGYANNLNAHNQFFETWLAAGFIPTLALITFFISLFFLKGRLQLYAGAFAIVCGINFLFESMLVRNIGVFPFVFWLLMIFKTEVQEYKEENKVISDIHKTMAVLWTFLLSGILIYSTTLEFDGNNPKSFLQVPYEESANNLPEAACGKSYNVDCNDLKYIAIEGGDFATIPFYNTRDDGKKWVSSSVWIYVPEDSPLGQLWLYIYNKRDKSEVVEYDLSKKGTWQYLKLDHVALNKSFEIGLRLDYFESNFAQLDDRSYISFAMPGFIIED